MSASTPGSPPGHLPWYRSGFEVSLVDFKAAIARNDEEAAFHALCSAWFVSELEPDVPELVLVGRLLRVLIELEKVERQGHRHRRVLKAH